MIAQEVSKNLHRSSSNNEEPIKVLSKTAGEYPSKKSSQDILDRRDEIQCAMEDRTACINPMQKLLRHLMEELDRWEGNKLQRWRRMNDEEAEKREREETLKADIDKIEAVKEDNQNLLKVDRALEGFYQDIRTNCVKKLKNLKQVPFSERMMTFRHLLLVESDAVKFRIRTARRFLKDDTKDSFLQADVEELSTEERQFHERNIRSVLEEVRKMCEDLSKINTPESLLSHLHILFFNYMSFQRSRLALNEQKEGQVDEESETIKNKIFHWLLSLEASTAAPKKKKEDR